MGSIRLNGRSYGGSPTVTDANHLTCEDGSGNTITAQSAIQNILGDFATIESSTAASKAYAVGDYLILNGNFYKVTTAISQGDTITVGTNVVRTNVGDEFKSFEFPVRELTKTQYTALPSSQQNDGTIYLITDDDGGWEAENSTYDNTSSGLNAENVQDALDEINSNIDDLGADDVTYDNTESGLTATNVQDALDEISSNIDDLGADDVPYSNSTSGLTATNVQGAVDELNSNSVHQILESNYKVTPIASGTSHVTNITLNAPSGYKFLCVTRAITNGWTGTVSAPIISQTSTSEIVDLWLNPATPNANCSVDVKFLVYK